MKNEKHFGIIISLILIFAITISSIVNGIFEQNQTIEKFTKQEETNTIVDDAITELQTKLKNLETELQNVEALGNLTDANQNKNINDLYTQITAIQKEIQTIKSQIATLEKEHLAQKTEIQNLQNRMFSIENKQPKTQTINLALVDFYRYMGVKVTFTDLTSTKSILNGDKINLCNVNFEFYPIVPNIEFDYAQITIELNTAPGSEQLLGCGTPMIYLEGGYYPWFVHNMEKEITIKIPSDGYFTVSMQIYQPTNNQTYLPCLLNDTLFSIVPKGWANITE